MVVALPRFPQYGFKKRKNQKSAEENAYSIGES